MLYLLLGCQQQAGDESCQLNGENILLDADFALEAADRESAHWVARNHAGEPLSEISVNNGVLTITRKGAQSWFVFKQRVKGPDFSGMTAVFEADIKLGLLPPGESRIRDDAGLSLIALDGSGRFLGNSTFEHEPHTGKSDWVPVRVAYELPLFTRALDVGFQHEANGTLRVKRPSLQLVKGTPEDCLLSQ
jgi:hypothetical protein